MSKFKMGDLQWNKSRTAAVQRIRIQGEQYIESKNRSELAKAYSIFKLWYYNDKGELVAERYRTYPLALKARTKFNAALRPA